MKRSITRRVILIALTLVFGLQAYRVFLPKVIWYLGQYLVPEQMALLALAVFATCLLTPLLYRLLGARGLLGLTVGGLALVYLALSLSDSAPLYLALSILGLALLGWFLPFIARSSRNHSAEGDIPALAVAFPLSFIFDTALRSLLWTYDLVWRHDLLSRSAAAALVVAALILLWRELIQDPGETKPMEPLLGRILPLAGLGPFLYLAIALLHNPAALAAATGWSDLTAHLAVNAFAAIGALVCVLAVARPIRQRQLQAVIFGILLIIVLALINTKTEPQGPWFGLGVVCAWTALGWLLGDTGRLDATQPGLWRTSLAIFMALVALLVIIFLVAQFELYVAMVGGGVLLALTAIWATTGPREANVLFPIAALRQVGAAILLALVIVGAWAYINRPLRRTANPPMDAPLRVMTYNIHQGIDADMVLNLEAIAAAIEEENPDVLALNEVNRARAVNGFVDVLGYLSQRLEMPYIFGANYTDGQYGNALLTHYPIERWSNYHFQTNTTEVRGVLKVTLQKTPEPITFFATHLDHIETPDNARAAQATEMLALWDGDPRSVILGDLNAEPGTPEIELIDQAGFIDLLEASGQGEVFTFWYADPQPGQRIDYIFITPDLPYCEAWAPLTRASDHLPVVGELGP